MTEVANEEFLIENNVDEEYLMLLQSLCYYSLEHIKIDRFWKHLVKKIEALKILNTRKYSKELDLFKRKK